MSASGFGTVLINLDTSRDRLDHMSRQLEQAGLSFTRQPAIRGTAIPEVISTYLLDANGYVASTLKPGEVGCYASHLLIHFLMVEGQLPEIVLVLEDDLIVSPDLSAVLGAALEALPEQWDIVRLSNPPKRAYMPVATLPGNRELVQYSKIPNNTGAYLISRSGAEKFLAAYRPRRRAVDEDLRRPWEFGLKTYGIVPPPIVSNIFDSTIDALGDRGLGRPRTPKVLTGRTENPLRGIGRARWNIEDLGAARWLRCLARNISNTMRPKLPRSAAAQDIVARYRIPSDDAGRP